MKKIFGLLVLLSLLTLIVGCAETTTKGDAMDKSADDVSSEEAEIGSELDDLDELDSLENELDDASLDDLDDLTLE